LHFVFVFFGRNKGYYYLLYAESLQVSDSAYCDAFSRSVSVCPSVTFMHSA